VSRITGTLRRWVRGGPEKDVARSDAVVTKAGSRAEWAAALGEDELTAELAALRRDADETPDAGARPFPSDDVLTDFLALAREAADRSISLRPFDVQLLGALRLMAGNVVEMATGEGKTLSGAIAAAAFALDGRHVHVISVNDYLAHRDAEWMGPLYTRLGVTVGSVEATSSPDERRAAYAADVTYGSVSEIGFDVLRDRLATSVDELVSPEPQVALVDEADSVMVDEALVPLVIAGSVSGTGPSPLINKIVRALRPHAHHRSDADERNVHLTDAGARAVESALGGIDLYAAENLGLLTQVNVALHAHVLLQRDVHYLVRDGKVALINASRGRVAHLQRWPDGLQSAVESKEGLALSESGEVLDTITVQGLLGRYPTLCGMTGTATAAAEQLRTHFRLEVATVPPNAPTVRSDEPDRVYDTPENKEDALVAHVQATHEAGQPVLVGTLDVAESERLAAALTAAGVDCVVLNAKNDAEEAGIVAEAGAPGAVVVSTQMAGRGTDIRLGGSAETDRDAVVEAGGLCVIGSGKHTSSRLDDQLRGRAGRQGDPGRTVFFTSVRDDLVTTNTPDAEPVPSQATDGKLTTPRAARIVEHAQKVAEAALEEVHRNTWRYNQLIETQRAILDTRRDDVLRTDRAARDLEVACPDRWAELAQELDGTVLEEVARTITLHHLDRQWAEHLAFLADLRESIHLRALSRQNPLDEFHRAMIPAFTELSEQVGVLSAETLTTATITDAGVDLELEGLSRPTATWTYMVHDNPFGTEIARAAAAVLGSSRRRNR
jgi:preprotein translocase subunit SecA